LEADFTSGSNGSVTGPSDCAATGAEARAIVIALHNDKARRGKRNVKTAIVMNPEAKAVPSRSARQTNILGYIRRRNNADDMTPAPRFLPDDA
jgi:hypothetical protein